MRHGRYIVVRKLAEGGMAEIFLAKLQGPEGFEKPVVLKRIHRAFFEDRNFRDMLVDEAHVSMGLQHNNIVQILDVGRAQDQFFLVLEIVDGWDLSRILERAEAARRLLPLGLGLYIVAEICRALAYAHAKISLDGRPLGIVHRDVSPQNVLISEQGEVKLADFGIAKAMTKREQTGSGVVKGKISFMSPEQANGHHLDHRSDIFAVGSLLYLLATGARPFEATTDLETLLRVQEGKFTPAEYVAPDLSPALAAVIRRAMGASPDDRYQTADELLVDLEGILRAEYGSAGQTELKLWLADLSRRDGLPPISRQRHTPTGADEGADPLAGNAVQLGDDDEGAEGTGDQAPPRGRRRSPSSPSLHEGDERVFAGVGDGRRDELDAGFDGRLEGGLESGFDPGFDGGRGGLEGRLDEGRSGLFGARGADPSGRLDIAGSAPRSLGTEVTALTDLELAVPGDELPPEDRFAREARRRRIGVSLVTIAILGGGGFWIYRNWDALRPPARTEVETPAATASGAAPAAGAPAALPGPGGQTKAAAPGAAVPSPATPAAGGRAEGAAPAARPRDEPRAARPAALPARERRPGEPHTDPRTGLPRFDLPSEVDPTKPPPLPSSVDPEPEPVEPAPPLPATEPAPVTEPVAPPPSPAPEETPAPTEPTPEPAPAP